MKTVPQQQAGLMLVGAGNVGRRFLELLTRKQATLQNRLGLDLRVVGVADTSGAAICPQGLELDEVVALKSAGQGVANYRKWGRAGVAALEMVESTGADLFLEASPAKVDGAQPALACIEAALSVGMHVVTANKAPLVVAFPRLLALAEEHGVKLRFDATVAGGLPAINLGQRDLAAADILRLEGILNLTTNYVLTRMEGHHVGYDQALYEMQVAGHAEADPTLDVDGWDAAYKLVILSNSVLGHPATLENVSVEGIRGVSPAVLEEAIAEGKRVRLVATAEKSEEGYRLSVKPAWLDGNHPLARLAAVQMGIVYHTDIMGVISAAITEETPLPTAAAMLRDVVDIYGG